MGMHSLGTVTLAALLIPVSTAAQSPLPRIEKAIQSQLSQGQFMGAVLIARNGRVILGKGYGKANLEWGVPNSLDTRFRLASMTKT